VADYSGVGVTGFHHNIDPGREGMILDVDTVEQTESVNLEVDAAGNVLRTWNLADIISATMIAGGDDPRQFVHPASIDWFHNNACAYRRSDNSLIVSSRENFVIAIDYDSRSINGFWAIRQSTGISSIAASILPNPGSGHITADRRACCVHAGRSIASFR
jgi:hypothetical protein